MGKQLVSFITCGCKSSAPFFVMIILGQYFDKRRGIATGIAISGGCLGGLLLPPIYRILLDTYGLRGTLMLTGGLLFHNTAMK
jgi:nitrate/nitrite transporter NarK